MDEARSVVFILAVVVVVALGAAWLFCSGLSELLRWEFCDQYLGTLERMVRTVTRSWGR